MTTTIQSDDEDITSGSGDDFQQEIFSSNYTNVTVYSPTTSEFIASKNQTSVTILAVVAVVAILTLIIFAAVTFRYLFVHQGSYRVHEFKTDAKPKRNNCDDVKLNNVYEMAPSREWLL